MKTVTTMAKEIVQRLTHGTCRGCNDIYKKPNLEISLTKHYKKELENVPLKVSGSTITSAGISTNEVVKYAVCIIIYR